VNNSTQNGNKTFDWAAVHQRIELSRAAVEQGFKPSKEQKERILKQRAELLSKVTANSESDVERYDVLEFLMGNEKYAIESTHVSEVYPIQDLSPLPCTPRFVLGVINVRGQILCVIDLRAVFDLSVDAGAGVNKIIILRTAEMEVGVRADAILGVRSISEAEIYPAPATLTGPRAEFLKGVTDASVALLDVPKILSDKRIIVHEEVDG